MGMAGNVKQERQNKMARNITPSEISEYVTAYPSKGGILANWHGERMGTWRSTSKWRVNSAYGTHMHQIVATLDDGRIYAGRGFGEGMSFRGKRIRAQR